MEKAELLGCAVWLYAGWIGFCELRTGQTDWRLGFLSLSNCFLFFGYQFAAQLYARRTDAPTRALLWAIGLCDCALMLLTQFLLLRGGQRFIAALGLFAGGVNVAVYFSKVVFLAVLLVFAALSAFLNWSDERERRNLQGFLARAYSAAELGLSLRDARALLRRHGDALCALPILDAEKALVARLYARRSRAADWAQECIICLSPFTRLSFVCRIACIHKFHTECLLNWFGEKPHCPLCRRPFRPKLLRDLLAGRSRRLYPTRGRRE